MKTPYFRDMTPRHWVIDYRCFKGTWCLRNVGNRFTSDNALYPRRMDFSLKMRQSTNVIFSNSKITHDSEKYLFNLCSITIAMGISDSFGDGKCNYKSCTKRFCVENFYQTTTCFSLQVGRHQNKTIACHFC